MAIGNAVNGPEAAPYLAKAGGTMTGALTLNSSSPASDLIAASKGYVDSVAQGRVFKDPCAAASTGALTVTYNNGASGVGATLTNNGALAAFSLDGVSGALNDRFLIKDQASTLQNGIYVLTTVGSGAVAWVLTRATDMDLAAEFKGGTTFIIGGTTNAGRTYTETATVATVGTDAVTFVLTGDSTSGALSVVQQIFTANGTYTPTAGMAYCVIEVVGSGGGGGGASANAANTSGGSGGGAGGYSKGVFDAATIGASQAVTVGAAGAAGTAAPTAGGNGNTTSVGGLIQATGGSGGVAGTDSATAVIQQGGAGGIGSLGSLNIQGGAGGWSLGLAPVLFAAGGQGGNSVYGGGGLSPAGSAHVAGNAGGVYGAGGSGGYVADNNSVAGGAGAAGVVYITEYVLT